MKSLNLLSLLCVCFLVCGSILKPVVTYASPYDLMINTDSNALMTLSLDDSDYSASLMSSIASITNTVDWEADKIVFRVYCLSDDGNNNLNYYRYPTEYTDEGIRFTFNCPDGYYVSRLYVYNVWNNDYSNAPASGNYLMSVDVSSSFSHDYGSVYLVSNYSSDNAEPIDSITSINDYVTTNSGDMYINSVPVSIPSGLNRFGFRITYLDQTENIDILLKENFSYTSSSDVISSARPSLTDSEVSDQISSSVNEIAYSTNSIFNSLQELIQHISNQLAALWDQMYNYMHVPHMAKLDEVISAIQNIDIEFQIDFDELKTSINNMSTAVQNKLQATTDQITGGFDNAQQATQNEQLSGAINEYDQIESDVFEDATGFMGELEYSDLDSMPMGIIKALAFIGAFLQSIFICMGDFSVIITFSLTMIFVMIVIGYHRIRS